MDKLIPIFLAEATELCDQLEKSLLELENDPQNIESISSVFRSMHTLKGAAGMFGFENINSITHHLESIFEEIRDGKRELSKEILNITFKTLDHLQTLMKDPKLEKPESLKVHQNLTEKILEIADSKSSNQVIINKNSIEITKTYYIYFLPEPNILKKGTNPFYLIEDLLYLGNGISLPFIKELPNFDEFEPNKSFFGFEIILNTSKPEQDIKDVFLFVENDCELIINSLNISEFTNEGVLYKQLLREQSNFQFKGYEHINKIITNNLASEVTKTTEISQAKKTTSSIRVSSANIDELMNLMSELVTTQAQLSLLTESSENPELILISENVEKITRKLRDNVFSISLIPLENLVIKFQRLVRDLSKELNKDVIFITEGTETEIDKSIVEKLSDPLLHILRNSLDHGIESPEERLKSGKNIQGKIILKSYYSGANVIIDITDDGAGIDLERVKQKAISKGLIDSNIQLNESELVNLIFLPGFSTAEKVTGVSGRGVGMDVVKNNISDIRGEISIKTQKGFGTTFSISLPLTLSIIDGLLVKIGETKFIIPLATLNKCYEIETNKLEQSHNDWVTLDSTRTPFILLRKHFNINSNSPELSQIIKLKYDEHYIGIVVDSIIGQYQAVLKPLGQFYKYQDEFSGATILGDGTVALVIDTNKLIKKFVVENEIQNSNKNFNL